MRFSSSVGTLVALLAGGGLPLGGAVAGLNDDAEVLGGASLEVATLLEDAVAQAAVEAETAYSGGTKAMSAGVAPIKSASLLSSAKQRELGVGGACDSLGLNRRYCIPELAAAILVTQFAPTCSATTSAMMSVCPAQHCATRDKLNYGIQASGGFGADFFDFFPKFFMRAALVAKTALDPLIPRACLPKWMYANAKTCDKWYGCYYEPWTSCVHTDVRPDGCAVASSVGGWLYDDMGTMTMMNMEPWAAGKRGSPDPMSVDGRLSDAARMEQNKVCTIGVTDYPPTNNPPFGAKNPSREELEEHARFPRATTKMMRNADAIRTAAHAFLKSRHAWENDLTRTVEDFTERAADTRDIIAGHTLAIMFRITPHMRKYVEATKLQLGWKHPIVAVQIRGTDIFTERPMLHAEAFADAAVHMMHQQEQRTGVPCSRVYLATDIPNMDEAMFADLLHRMAIAEGLPSKKYTVVMQHAYKRNVGAAKKDGKHESDPADTIDQAAKSGFDKFGLGMVLDQALLAEADGIIAMHGSHFSRASIVTSILRYGTTDYYAMDCDPPFHYYAESGLGRWNGMGLKDGRYSWAPSTFKWKLRCEKYVDMQQWEKCHEYEVSGKSGGNSACDALIKQGREYTPFPPIQPQHRRRLRGDDAAKNATTTTTQAPPPAQVRRRLWDPSIPLVTMRDPANTAWLNRMKSQYGAATKMKPDSGDYPPQYQSDAVCGPPTV